ncbi:hypothetical protein CVT24_007654 [Panaeolus cyanescens]|uniref:F-box domain-containing protein n=1 Tax=Panaeolus cyanescens TaxID=181874 RepID=A0A409YWU4_9AGAR|nr:hypothetical protein CVT24_007654 [Panaeolus cyanescens]
MPRWQRVSVHLTEAKDMRHFLYTLIPEEGKSPAALLQHLHISANYDAPDLLNSDSFSRLSSFPHPTLRRFTWNVCLMPDFFPRVSTSLWTNLQQISLDITTTRILHSFLKACTNVRFVCINTIRTFIEADNVITPTIAHALQSLNIGLVLGDLTETIALLTAPNLKRLSYENSAGSGQSKGLEDFLRRSGCQLESLCIVCTTPDFDEAETKIMLRTPMFTAIPNFSLHLIEEGCHPSFPQAIIAETAAKWSATAYVHYEPKNYGYHLGWGTIDMAHVYQIDYPFLVKSSTPTIKWTVSFTDGPLTSA